MIDKEKTIVLNHSYLAVVGIREIEGLLLNYTGYAPSEFDYSLNGTRLSRRLSKYYHVNHAIKLSSEVLQQIGNLVNLWRVPEETVTVKMSHFFHWNCGDFGDGHSCFWRDRSEAREIFDDNDDMFSVRIWDKLGIGVSRCWGKKLDDWSLVLFNAYGQHSLRQIANLVKELNPFDGNLTIADCRLVNDGSASVVYVNSSAGVLVGTDASQVYPSRHIDLELDGDGCLTCAHCGYDVDEIYALYGEQHGMLCEECFHELYAYCEGCNEYYPSEDLVQVTRMTYRNGAQYIEVTDYCEYCARENNAVQCDNCQEWYHIDDIVAQTEDGQVFCENCEHLVGYCDSCEEYFLVEDTVEAEGLDIIRLDGREYWATLCKHCAKDAVEKYGLSQFKQTNPWYLAAETGQMSFDGVEQFGEWSDVMCDLVEAHPIRG